MKKELGDASRLELTNERAFLRYNGIKVRKPTYLSARCRFIALLLRVSDDTSLKFVRLDCFSLTIDMALKSISIGVEDRYSPQ